MTGRWLKMATLLAFLIAPAGAAADDRLVERVSLGPTGGNGSFHTFGITGPFGESPVRQVSADGSRVLFQTYERLVAEDTDSSLDLYVRHDGVTELVTTGPRGGNGPFTPDVKFVSPDGLRVRFLTEERLVSEDTDNLSDLYERQGSQTTLITRGDAPFDPVTSVISLDGTTLAFWHRGSLLPSDQDYGDEDIYKLSPAGLELVSLDTFDPTYPPFLFAGSFISRDGSRILFTSNEDLAGDRDRRVRDVFQYHDGHVELVSTGPNDINNADMGGDLVGASADGSHVFFETYDPLTSDDGDNRQDVYERFGGQTTLVSTGPGDPVAADMDFVNTTSDGERVLFRTDGALVPPDPDDSRTECPRWQCQDVFERHGGRTSLVSTGPADVRTATSPGSGSGEPYGWFTESTAGPAHLFFSTRLPMVAADTDLCTDIYARAGAAVELISTGPADTGCATGIGFGGASSDGSRVFFSSGSALVPADTDSDCVGTDYDDEYFTVGCSDVYERHLGHTTLLSTGPNSSNGPYGAGFAGASLDGRTVAIDTGDPLVADDTDHCFDDPFGRDLGCSDLYVVRPEPPDCSGVKASVTSLWPANGKWNEVSLTGARDAAGAALPVSVTGATQDEPVTGKGDSTRPDARLTPAGARLRAERSNKGDGRVYSISFEARDGDGGSCSGSLSVGVPRHKGRAPVDSRPPSFDSL